MGKMVFKMELFIHIWHERKRERISVEELENDRGQKVNMSRVQ